MARILILREREAATRTGRLLASAGHEPVILPTQAIRPLAPSSPQGPFAAVIVTSANAAPWLLAQETLRTLPVLAVGERSAAPLRRQGRTVELSADGTGAGLAAAAGAHQRRTGHPILYAAGRVRTAGLERALEEAAIPFEAVEVYDTVPLEPAPADLEAATAAGGVDAVLLLSRGQAEAFERLRQREPASALGEPVLLCLSARIAEALQPQRRARALIAERPELFALLRRYRHVQTLAKAPNEL